jgi:hypothetical protein
MLARQWWIHMLSIAGRKIEACAVPDALGSPHSDILLLGIQTGAVRRDGSQNPVNEQEENALSWRMHLVVG